MKQLKELGISPAPWQVHDDDRVLCTKSPAVYSVCNRGAYVGRNEWAADARLIAAAPELYEALRQLVDYLSLNNWTDRELYPYIEAADNALAKAGGESEKGEAK